jgi:hypothetical protein
MARRRTEAEELVPVNHHQEYEQQKFFPETVIAFVFREDRMLACLDMIPRAHDWTSSPHRSIGPRKNNWYVPECIQRRTRTRRRQPSIFSFLSFGSCRVSLGIKHVAYG